MDTALFIGYSASICSVASFVPQAWKIYQSGQTAAISAPMYVLTVGGFALWTWFGFLRGELPIIFTNAVCLILSGSILMMKLRRRFRPPVDTTKP